jgi:hypothetical protein
VRQLPTGAARFVEQYRRHQLGEGLGYDALVTSRRRFVAITLALTPMLALAVLPATFLVAVIVGMFGEMIGIDWIGPLLLVLAWLTIAAVVAQRTVYDARGGDDRGWRRWLPLATVAALVVLGLIEIASGSNAADPVLLMWLVAIVWCFVFIAHAHRPWPPATAVMWALAPIVVTVVLVLAGTGGLFSLRFARSEDALTDLARKSAAGETVLIGTKAGWFEITRRDQVPGCDAGFRIDGWYQTDDRWVAWCPEQPPLFGEHSHLTGDWYEITG